jgi:hypothetical protein
MKTVHLAPNSALRMPLRAGKTRKAKSLHGASAHMPRERIEWSKVRATDVIAARRKSGG